MDNIGEYFGTRLISSDAMPPGKVIIVNTDEMNLFSRKLREIKVETNEVEFKMTNPFFHVDFADVERRCVALSFCGFESTYVKDTRCWLEKIIDWCWNKHLEIKSEMRRLGF